MKHKNLGRSIALTLVVLLFGSIVVFSGNPVNAGSSCASISYLPQLLNASCCAIKPEAYYGQPYLTWQGDPSTTMTINYHTAERPAMVVVQYDTASAPSEYAFSATGESWQIPELEDGRFINSVEITGLTPGATYYFRLGDYTEFSEEYKFRTISDGNEPLCFAIGGDALATPAFGELISSVAAQDPQFVVIGGDLAYANGDIEQVDQWNNWLGRWHKNARTPDGCLIPMVMALGNHETNKLEGTFEERAPFFFGFFPQGGKTFWSQQFGANLGFLFIDSGHLASHAEQVPWIEEQLKKFQAAPFRVAAYHVPLYPSHRDYDGGGSATGREHWLPLFDAYQLTVGFEHHDHTFKRTKRLRNNEVNPEGTLYVGDGNAGVMPRVPKEGLWYMEKVSRDSHFWVVNVSPTEMHLRAINRSGVFFDETTIAAP